MDWMQVLTIIGANLCMFLWATQQARTDFYHMDTKLDENRKETQRIVKETQQLVKSIQETVQAIQTEMHDFHNRLCAIEERRK
jgi:hypothetical protein